MAPHPIPATEHIGLFCRLVRNDCTEDGMLAVLALPECFGQPSGTVYRDATVTLPEKWRDVTRSVPDGLPEEVLHSIGGRIVPSYQSRNDSRRVPVEHSVGRAQQVAER